MSSANSIANSKNNRKRWSKLSKKERSKRMSDLVKKRFAKMTKKQRSEYGKMMSQARNKKRDTMSV